MKKQWRSVFLLAAPFAALAIGAWGWHRTTPAWESAWVPWGNQDDLRFAYEGELRVPSVASAVGYSVLQSAADNAVRERSAQGWREIQAETRRMEAAGASKTAVSLYRSKASNKATAASRRLTDGWLPSLTREQKAKLWPRLVGWTGVWIMSDRRVAARVGLSEIQRAEFARTADRVRWYYNDEHNAWGRQMYIYEGAPASAIAALGEQQRHTIRCQGRTDGECGPEGQTISDQTVFSPSRSVPRWVDVLAFDLIVRRAVAFRREEEIRLLGSLTPDQRRRWETLKAGQDPV